MRQIEVKKLLTIITQEALQRMVVDQMKKRGIGGYTVVPATGAGASGMMVSGASVMIHVILSQERLQKILVDIDQLMTQGYRLKAFYQDISILPRKQDATSPPEGDA